ncbi:MAG: DNA mismatch endonuclease Vsr [Candidatus Sumerlaeia bacterium]|nr:DNA mismatch endonuclease Vsr [Candidatus Sumerlaeia bacterium]
MDKLSPERRSENMRRIRNRDMKPELTVRSAVHRMGHRFRLHGRGLPGKPDLVFPGQRKVIFVHGCFWHQHAGCPEASRPKSNRDYWRAKLRGNVRRDRRNLRALDELGWSALVVWECDVERRLESVRRQIQRFLCGGRVRGNSPARGSVRARRPRRAARAARRRR